MADSESSYKCPQCSKDLAERNSSFGSFYGCKGYPNCKYTAQIGPNGEPQEKNRKSTTLSEHTCPVCKKSKMIKRKGQRGDFYGCSSYPKCKGVLDKDGNLPKRKNEKKKSENKTKDVVDLDDDSFF